MRLKLFLCLLCLSFLVAGCDLLSEITFPSLETPRAPTLTPQPSAEPQPTATLADIPILQPTITLQPPLPIGGYMLQAGPFYLPNFAHPDAACDWLGVAGQVFDQEGLEILGLKVIAGNVTNVEGNHWESLTGLSTAYGLGGYEIRLSDEPADSTGVYWVQVVDQDNQPLSTQVFFDTFQDCERNLVLVNFIPKLETTTP